MKSILLLCGALAALAPMTRGETAAPAPDARVAMREGLSAFTNGQYDAAAEAFAAAAEHAGAIDREPSVAHFNRGLALYRAAKWDAAAEAFQAARQTQDLNRQAQALYNAALCRLRQVDAAFEAKQGQQIERHFAEALDFLEQSLLLSPGNPDARHNLEVALGRLRALNAAAGELGVVVKTAESLIDRHQFPEAFQVLEKAQTRLAPALLLPRPESKTFEQLREKSGQIAQILEAAPTAPDTK